MLAGVRLQSCPPLGTGSVLQTRMSGGCPPGLAPTVLLSHASRLEGSFEAAQEAMGTHLQAHERDGACARRPEHTRTHQDRSASVTSSHRPLQILPSATSSGPELPKAHGRQLPQNRGHCLVARGQEAGPPCVQGRHAEGLTGHPLLQPPPAFSVVVVPAPSPGWKARCAVRPRAERHPPCWRP